MNKATVELTIIGDDREGVVAGFTNFIFQNGGNIEKINQNFVKGLFGMYLESSFTKKMDIKKFNREEEKLANNPRIEDNIYYEASRRKITALIANKEGHLLQSIL